jgi:DNA-binding transcriptional MerR regulator
MLQPGKRGGQARLARVARGGRAGPLTRNGGSVSTQREEIPLDPGPRSGVYTDFVKMKKRTTLPPMRSGQLARLADVSPDTLRLYERKGLLPCPQRSVNGYRCYPPEAVARVSLIRSALAIGFTLNELSTVLKIRDAGGVPCHKVRNLAASKLRALDGHIRRLLELRDHLILVLARWEQVLGQGQPRSRARLLESLAAAQCAKSKPLPLYLYATLSEKTIR